MKNLFKVMCVLLASFGVLLTSCNSGKTTTNLSEPTSAELSEPSEPSELSEASELSELSEQSESDELSEPDEQSEPDEPVISYTAAEAIDAVAELISATFKQTVTAQHNDNGDYIVLNFGDAEAADVKGICEKFIPEGFELGSDWAEDTFEDGTPVEYADYSCGKTVLEFLVYKVSGYEGDEAGYNGLYLQIGAFLPAE